MKKIIRNLLLTSLLSLSFYAQAQSLQAVKAITPGASDEDKAFANLHYSTYTLYEQQPTAIVDFIKNVEASYNANGKYRIALPTISGEVKQFEIYSSGILSSYYQAHNKQVKAFKGQSEDKAYTVRLTLSPLGVMGKIKRKSDAMSWYIQPLHNSRPEVLIVYASNDEKLRAGKTIHCNTEDELENEIIESIKLNNAQSAQTEVAFGDCQLRVYRLAVATTGEYTTWAGGQTAALATLTNSVNIISEMYERDLTIRFSLVTNNNIIFQNENTDPYSAGGPSGTVITQNNTTLNNATYLGSTMYDVGVLFGYGTGWSGGLAQLSSVCTNSKGRSAGGLNSGWPTGSSGPVFDGTMAHEIGHQFSATHTMSANTGGCGTNLSSTSMWEAVGGSTIMAYAGTCNPLQYQWNSDDYFHAGNINQMITFLNSGINTCAQVSNSNNFSPTTSTNGNTFSIPHSTPFKLQINATDNNDNLTYTFDQLDNAVAGGVSYVPQDTSTVGPLFQSRYPSAANFRHYPSLAIQNGQEDGTYEVLPSVARTINIRGVVRDNNDEAGCVAYENFTINVQNCGSFEFTNLFNDTSVVADGTNTLILNWLTASTCVNTSNVAIKFSKDGGKTFPYTLLASTPNDGTETIIIPNLATCNGRIIIEALGNIYYAINTGTISIASACIVNGTAIAPDSLVTAQVNSPILNLAHLQPLASDSTVTVLAGTLSNAVAPSMLSVKNLATNGCVSFGNQAFYTTFEVYPTVTTIYTFIKSVSSSSVINIYEGTFDPNNPCTGFLNSATTVPNPSSGATIGSSVSQSLCANQQYTIVVTSFSGSSPTLPHAFSINVTSNTNGAELKLNAPGLPSGSQYGYVIVNNTNNQIVAIVDTVDMSNGATYSVGNYTVYGISTTNSLSLLNTTYANTNFSTFYNATLNQNASICAELSSNAVPVNIIEPLPTALISFTGNITTTNTAYLQWKVDEDDDISYYELEKSTIGSNYDNIATIKTKFDIDGFNIQTYNYEDVTFKSTANPYAHYRLKIVDKENNVQYSHVVALQSLNNNQFVAIAPNPIENDEIQVILHRHQKGLYEFNIVNLLGNSIKQTQFAKEEGKKNVQISINELPAGIYFLQVKCGSAYEVIKFVKP